MHDPGMSARGDRGAGIAESRDGARKVADASETDGTGTGRVECASCGAPLGEGVSLAESESQPARWKCLRCALFDRTLAARSGRVALFVGTVLIAVNQGDQLLSGRFPFATSWWKLPLTYLVPFLVASYGAISNGYRPVPRKRGSPPSRSG